MYIEKITAREIFDSRGFPTVEARVELESGAVGIASVPSGASTGSHEAHELRDGGKRLMGKGVTRAVDHVRGEIARALIGQRADDQRALDEAMCALDGTENLSRLGANAILSVSLASAEAAADAYGMPLYRYLGGVAGGGFPLPMMNVLNGGAHASNNVDIQEFMYVPVGADSFERAMRMCVEAYHALRALITQKGLSTALGDEGGFAPNIESDEQALELMAEAVANAGMTLGKDIAFALDVAATEWYEDGGYVLPKRGEAFTRDALIDHFASLAKRHPIISIEDPLGEDDFEGFAQITARLPGVMIVGDDLFV
ncbi:MAG: phosphopyruvate hydratase, partial [Christensenellales bacterium]